MSSTEKPDLIESLDQRMTESSISKFSKSDPPHVQKVRKAEEELQDLDKQKKESKEEDMKKNNIQREPKSQTNLCCENKKKNKKKKSEKGFWGSMMMWSRKSNSDAEKIQKKFVKARVQVNEWIDNHVSNIAWFTYRKGFHASFYENLRSDSGWGCMIRSGQMLLFTVLKRLLEKKIPAFLIISKEKCGLIARELFY